VTAISLLSIKVDSAPEQIRLDPANGLLLRLEAGVHLNLDDASEETCRALARHFLTAAQIKKVQLLPEVA
jgi:hypothetical protein